MPDIYPFRETRVFQEAREEGLREMRDQFLKVKLDAIPKLAAYGISAAEIAEIFKLEEALINETLGYSANKHP